MIIAVREPMEALLLRYRRLLGEVQRNIALLEGDAPPAVTSTADEQPHPLVRLETGPADLSALLAFQERLAELDGVLRVTIAGSNESRTTFLVELEGGPSNGTRPQRTVCARCGKVLTEGDLPTSHGLCDDCGNQFFR